MVAGASRAVTAIRAGATSNQSVRVAYTDPSGANDELGVIQDAAGNDMASIAAPGRAADTYRGRGGNDALIGGGGNDIRIGGADNDVLTGGSKADIVCFESALSSTTTVIESWISILLKVIGSSWRMRCSRV